LVSSQFQFCFRRSRSSDIKMFSYLLTCRNTVIR
jgi:hypothetical protein